MPVYATLKSGKGEDPKGQPEDLKKERRGNEDEEDLCEAVHSDPQPGGPRYLCWCFWRLGVEINITQMGVSHPHCFYL